MHLVTCILVRLLSLVIARFILHGEQNAPLTPCIILMTGTWKAGKRHGFGVFQIKKTGDCYRGNWESGSKCGAGVYEYEDGELGECCSIVRHIHDSASIDHLFC